MWHSISPVANFKVHLFTRPVCSYKWKLRVSKTPSYARMHQLKSHFKYAEESLLLPPSAVCHIQLSLVPVTNGRCPTSRIFFFQQETDSRGPLTLTRPLWKLSSFHFTSRLFVPHCPHIVLGNCIHDFFGSNMAEVRGINRTPGLGGLFREKDEAWDP